MLGDAHWPGHVALSKTILLTFEKRIMHKRPNSRRSLRERRFFFCAHLARISHRRPERGRKALPEKRNHIFPGWYRVRKNSGNATTEVSAVSAFALSGLQMREKCAVNCFPSRPLCHGEDAAGGKWLAPRFGRPCRVRRHGAFADGPVACG